MQHSLWLGPTSVLCLALLLPGSAAPRQTPARSHASASAIEAPTLGAEKPADYPGIHNVVAYAEAVYSGSVPEGETGFDTLQKMGVRTIISVDGAKPEVELAKKHGMRYVHLPIGYDGAEPVRTLEISRAVKELDGPIYLHCHHGKHRSASAAGAAAVTLGYTTSEQALARMRVSGTAADYTGLFDSVKNARKATAEELESASAEFPPLSKTSGMVETMVAVDSAMDHLKEIEKAGWKAPSSHPDLVPAAEAGRLADLLRNLGDDAHTKAKNADFATRSSAGSKAVESLEQGLTSGASTEELASRMKLVAASCRDCHAKHRD